MLFAKTHIDNFMAFDNSGTFFDEKTLSRLQRSSSHVWNDLEHQNELRLNNRIIDRARHDDLPSIHRILKDNREQITLRKCFEIVCEFASPATCVEFFGSYSEIAKMEDNLTFYFKWAKLKVIAKEINK